MTQSNYKIFTLMLFIFLIGCNQENIIKYSNEVGGYSIEYPPTWERRILDDEVNHVIFSAKKEQGYYGFIAIRSGHCTDFNTHDIREILVNSSNRISQETINLIKFNGYEAVKSQNEFVLTNILEPNYEFITEHPTEIIVLTNGIQIAKIEYLLLFGKKQNEREIEKILESFQFAADVK